MHETENLRKIRVKNIKLAAVECIRAHSKKRPKTTEFIKNNPDLIRIVQAYPAYIRGLGLLSISPQIGYFRLLLPKLGLGYLRDNNIPDLIRISRLILPILGV